MNNKKIVILIAIGIVIILAIVAMYNQYYETKCSTYSNYSQYTSSELHSDPKKQLEIWKTEYGNSWASGHYDAEKDELTICHYLNIES